MIIAIKAFLLYTLFILVVIISCKVLGLGYSNAVYQCIEYLILGWVFFLASLFACKIWLF